MPNGWWDAFVGSGKMLDTDNYFYYLLQLFRRMLRSTGPSSINPITNMPYGGDFPHVQFSDIVDAQLPLFNHLGIDHFHAVIGSSLGGMIALLSTLSPKRVALLPLPVDCVLLLYEVHNLDRFSL